MSGGHGHESPLERFYSSLIIQFKVAVQVPLIKFLKYLQATGPISLPVQQDY